MTQRLIRLPEVLSLVGLRRSAVYARVRTGQFPAPKKITKYAVGWLESDIGTWIDQRSSSRSLPPRIRIRHRVRPGAEGGAQ